MTSAAHPDFQRAFVALSYVAGRRGGELLEPLSAPHDDAKVFAQRLAHPERERRAEILARELARIAVALEARSVK
ncbi:MAG TPA: hypothetical protein VHV51_07640 [Polyangiaceae bacterium]|jgi:hypothetical protein|nr:hypothetical protein [Polyangiaceae bacterium]